MHAAVVAILAAGASRRFGHGKLDADFGGQPLALWPVQTASQLGLPTIMVIGPSPPAIIGRLDGDIALITNPDPGRGIGSSIALAAAHARQSSARRLLIMLGDMPFVTAATLQQLVGQCVEGGAIACRYPDATLGPPACFGASRFAELELLDGDKGARNLLRDTARTISLAVAAAELRDIDTIDELDRLNRQRQAD